MNDLAQPPEPASDDEASIFEKIVQARRSVRGFLPDPVAADMMEAIFSLANRAPSNCNTQPWFVEVVSGSVRDRLSSSLLDAASRDQYSPDYPFDEKSYKGVLGERIKANAAAYYSAIEIQRHEKELREQAVLENLRFYGAPHAAFLFMPSYAGERIAADVGMYAQTLLLAMQARGVASCAQTILGFYANTVREVLGVSGDYNLLFGISFGYEDVQALGNRVRTPRVDLPDTTHFHQ